VLGGGEISYLGETNFSEKGINHFSWKGIWERHTLIGKRIPPVGRGEEGEGALFHRGDQHPLADGRGGAASSASGGEWKSISG